MLKDIYKGDAGLPAERQAVRPPYTSPLAAVFDRRLFIPADEGKRLMEYNAPVKTLVGELEAALAFPGSEQSNIAKAFHPPRLIRAAVDQKINEQRDAAWVQKAIGVGLAVYRDDPDAMHKLQSFRTEAESENPALLHLMVSQEFDDRSLVASNPARSAVTAQNLAGIHSGRDVLFLATGHGGTMAGLDTFAAYTDLTHAEDSSFYVLRFSRGKMSDTKPHLAASEIAYLQQEARTRDVVLFEEDIHTGRTIREAHEFFHTMVDGHVRITIISNLDMRHKSKKITRGTIIRPSISGS